MKMTFDVTGSREVLSRVLRHLREEATFGDVIRWECPNKCELVITFVDSDQRMYVPYFMNWLHFSGSYQLAERFSNMVVNPFSSSFKSIST